MPFRDCTSLCVRSMKMDKIEHSHLDANGFSLHTAYTGKGRSVDRSNPLAASLLLSSTLNHSPFLGVAGDLGAVLFLHGFPEIWYSWRHQMIAVAEAGFKAIAPDYRGYGLSDQPPEPESTTWEDIVTDLVAILDLLSIPKVYVVGKDFGVRLANDLALHRPDRVLGVVTLGAPFIPAGALSWNALPEGFYIQRWREPGRAEADFGRFDIKRVIRTIYILFSRSEIPIAEQGQEIMDLADLSTPLPPWFTEEDLNVYAALYEKSQLQFPLTLPYRLDRIKGVENPRIEVPALLIMGEKDYVLKFPGMEEYVRGGKAKRFVPKLETVYIPEGSHFVQEQFPDHVNKLIVHFLKNHSQVEADH
ncbi:hypothetical protein ZIOFF_008231 [Zingiber officinale]|uniref:AB hydrolase-1 domain-containing protein n=2 Tax=Zingiber officinale TaxID=94328 RepID=A0A8J5IF71_ZINOF|nr:hypothetical protein ZIOFF_008231 [Zingiber officinale]